MKSIITSFLMALLLFGGSVTSTAQYFSASTESDAYVYFIKGAGSAQSDRYWYYNGSSLTHTQTAPTNGEAAYQFKIIASSTAGKYYIYSVGAGQYLYSKATTAGADKVGLKADKADDALWYIPNDGSVANGVVDFVPGSLTVTDNVVGWNIFGGVSNTTLGLYQRNDANSKWSLIPADLATLNNYRSLVANNVQGTEPDYTKSLASRPAALPDADFDTWSLDNANSLVSCLLAFYPALPTGYYTIKNNSTDGRPQHIYGDLANNQNGYTLQNNNFVADARGVWKVVNNGNGTVSIINSNGDPIITKNNNAPTSHTTLHMAIADGKNGIYFTEAINASNGGTKVNDIYCLTTWTAGGINAADNRWEFSPTSNNPYMVNIYAPSNYTLGWRYSGTETTYSIIKRGGFFIDSYDGSEGSMSLYEFVLLDDKGNVVDGITPVVDSDARTITATISELPTGYYRIVSAYTGGTAASKSITSYQTQSNKLGWEVTDVNNGEQYWYIQGNATDGYTIQSAYFDSKKYMHTTTAGNSTTASSLVEESEASKYVISLINNSDQYTIKETESTSPLHGQFLIDGWSSGPLITWAGGENSASAWYFVPTTDVEAALASLNTLTAGIDYSKQVGTTVGTYSEPEGTTTEGLKELTQNYATYKAEVVAAIESGNVATMETAYNNFKTYVKNLITADLTTAYGTLTINQPVVGKLYRFKNKAAEGYYMRAASTGQMSMTQTVDDHSTIFMLQEGDPVDGKTAFKLLNYNTGYYTYDTRNNGKVRSEANSVLFKASEGGDTYTNDEGVKCSYYTLKTNYSNGPFTFGRTDNHNIDRHSYYQADNCDWIIEEVTWLPIPVSSTYMFGTLTSPAPLEISSAGNYGKDARMKFYTATIGEDNYVVLKKVENNIPANVPLVIELVTTTGMSQDSQFMQIASSAPALDATNALRGSFETIATSTVQGTIYTLQPAWDDNTGNHNSATEVAFRQYNGTNIQGFRAYLPVAPGVQPAGMRFYEGDVTRIEGVEEGQTHKVDVYDLSGRRVQRATKGLYIVNGKKVLVK